MSPQISAAELKEARKSLDPRTFPGVVAAGCMAIVCAQMYWQRQDAKEFQQAMIAALKEQTTAIQKLADELRQQDRRR